ncbi:AraC family transcriptional regulator [Rhodocytophaga aerolata]|uniref:AraC family transcriptional regulator n=2 Tax=Rhodocytophaga aerolata TaxID=455078 RepID=A0ABT8R496_9BACT|nr:AraC family transcriptional regulator [Rhodocytophaga aerolata]MDO1446924.1 AraC family transcriptional regulator [Rhodocytophaga aerolata]
MFNFITQICLFKTDKDLRDMDKIALPEWAKRFGSFEAKVLNSNERYTAIHTQFKEPGLASGESVIVQMPGMVLGNMLFNLQEPLNMTHPSNGEGAESVFVLEGRATSHFSHISKPVLAENNRHTFQYSPEFTAGHTIEKGRFNVVHIGFDMDFFKSIMQSAEDKQIDIICNSIERKQTFIPSHEHLLMQPRMLEILRAIKTSQFNGLTRMLYLEAKALELFSLQLDQFSSWSAGGKNDISRADKEKLSEVYAFIEANYLLPLSLAKLSAGYGLNEFKLKKGYKALFHMTVFGHIHNLRMRKAKQLLEEGSLNISQVSDCIGYSNIPAFSAAFKKHFGYPPSRYTGAALLAH